jgi:hypothetical protein
MSEERYISRAERWQPERDHRIEEGGWQKPVAPPRADSRPGGLPKANPPRPPSNTQSKEKSNG